MLFQVYTENGVKKIKYLTADTGAGAPVGSIIVVCSNILPSGYLGLGVHYDITNYPALYQVLGTDTTPTASALGLPTLSSGQYAIKATSGLTENQQENVLNTINENNSYSTEEHPTGKKWIDGKPIYEKTIVGTTETQFDVTGIDHLCVLKKMFEVVDGATTYFMENWHDEGSNHVIDAYYSNNKIRVHNIGYTLAHSWLTLEYTKTTD